LDALGKMGNRAVILSGWGKLSGKQSSDVLDASGKTDNLPVVLSGQDNRSSEQSADILVMDAVPHDWLLPRCKAIIHHGGAGTTAAGLHSGIPNVVVSFAADQPFWGARVHAIGAGPQPLRIKKLTVEKLVASLVEADGEISRTGAQTAGRKIRDENGIRAAVTLIEEHATRWRNLKIRGF